MKISRAWATPLTIGVFTLMSVTGLLMFFHLNRGLNKVAHEWAGWAMVAGVVLHATANWPAFKQHIFDSRLGQVLIGLGVVALAVSFVSLPGRGDRPPPPPVMAMNAVTRAPLASVAPLTGRPVDALLGDLARAGVKLPSAAASLDSVTADNRELQARAIGVLFGKSETPAEPRARR
jgi:hypothetical protein